MNGKDKIIKRLDRNIKLDYIYTLISNLNMQSSIWVLYLGYCDMNLMQIGVLEGIYHVTSIICEVPSGAMADLLGRRKSMIISRILIALSCIIMLFSKSFWLFACSFITQAMGNNFNSGSEEAFVYDSMKLLGKEQDYMRFNGRLNVIIEISQAIATVAGGVLAEFSYVWCYSACVMIALLTLMPLLFMVEPPILHKNEGKAKESGKEKRILQHFKMSVHILQSNKKILNIVGYYSAILAAYTLLFFYSQQYFANLGLNKIEISFIMLLAGGASCLGALSSEMMYQLLETKLVKLSAGIIAVSMVAYGFDILFIAVVSFIVASYFSSMLYPVQSASLNKLIPSSQRATLISVNSMFFSITMLIFFPIAGGVADNFGLVKVFMGLGILILAIVGLTVKIRLK
ncbi:MFS transporter [Anaerosacchariphilus polymeriproducens]|uniref:MFS transporter n=2 Tax=Anaerosacchariphilus polymeriproducens TaxID=1812858 RepID=A0A371AYW9_9FIRM|nr:MFS transporter [Anaerosacchariphilus polymeriproducens]